MIRDGEAIPVPDGFVRAGVSPSGKAGDFDSLIRWFESSIRNHVYLSIVNLLDCLRFFIHFFRKRVYLRPEMRIQSVGFKTQRTIMVP